MPLRFPVPCADLPCVFCLFRESMKLPTSNFNFSLNLFFQTSCAILLSCCAPTGLACPCSGPRFVRYRRASAGLALFEGGACRGHYRSLHTSSSKRRAVASRAFESSPQVWTTEGGVPRKTEPRSRPLTTAVVVGDVGWFEHSTSGMILLLLPWHGLVWLLLARISSPRSPCLAVLAIWRPSNRSSNQNASQAAVVILAALGRQAGQRQQGSHFLNSEVRFCKIFPLALAPPISYFFSFCSLR